MELLLFNSAILFSFFIVLGLSPQPINHTNRTYNNKNNINITKGLPSHEKTIRNTVEV
jgi:hypothetical protein